MMKSEKFEKTKLRDFIYSNCQVRAIEKKNRQVMIVTNS